jgi:hypothetical protein
MQQFAFTGCTDLRIMYFEYSVLALSINFKPVGNFLCTYGFTYVGVVYVGSRL